MASVTLRERKKARTREALVAAAFDLFSRQGFDGTTIEEIVDACEVSPRTFFRYFPSKEAVLYNDSEERCAALVDALAAQPGDVGPLDALHAAIAESARGFRDDRDMLVARARVSQDSVQLRAFRAEHLSGWETSVIDALDRRARAAGPPLSPFELRLLTNVGLGTLRAALDTWIDDASAPALEVLVDRAFATLAGFLGVSSGGGAGT